MPQIDRAASGGPLTIKQMAARSGLSEHTLRYYEKIGLITPIPRDSGSGHRRYDPDTARMIESLACLRSGGLSIDELRAHIRLRACGDDAAAAQKDLFASHAAALTGEIQRLQRQQRYLAGKVAYWEARERGDGDEARRIAEDNWRLEQELRL